MERFFAPIPIDLWVGLILGSLIWFGIVQICEGIRHWWLKRKGLLPPDPWDEDFDWPDEAYEEDELDERKKRK